MIKEFYKHYKIDFFIARKQKKLKSHIITFKWAKYWCEVFFSFFKLCQCQHLSRNETEKSFEEIERKKKQNITMNGIYPL